MVEDSSLLALAPKQELLARPFPRCGEGRLGYLLRLAEANRMSLREITKLGIQYDLDALSRMRLMPDPGSSPEVHDHIARMVLLKTKDCRWNEHYARFCPLCLKGEPTWPAAWEIHFYDACPRHRVWLLDQCSSCRSLVRWSRKGLLQCQCGAVLEEEIPADAPESVWQLAALLEAKLLGRPDPDPESPFVNLEVGQMQRLIRYLGAYVGPAANPRPFAVQSASRMDFSWPLTSLAAEIIVGWPSLFHRALSQLQAASAGEKMGLLDLFRQAYVYLYKGLEDKAFDPVREAFEAWLAENWKGGIAKRNRRLSEELLERVHWIPGNVAAANLGISMARLRSLIREGELDGQDSVSVSGRRFTMVRRDQLNDLRARLAGDIPMSEVISCLGLGKNRTRSLMRLLFPAARRTGEVGFVPWCVPKREVDALLTLGDRLPVVSRPEAHQVSLGYLLKYWNWTEDEIVALVEAVKAGAMVPDALLDEGKGITRWLFDAGKLRILQKTTNSQRSSWVSIPEMAKALNIKEQVAYWLTSQGIIRAERLKSVKGIGLRIRREELERFQQDYLFGRDIARILGKSSKVIIRILSEQRIWPLEGNTHEPCRMAVYARSVQLQEFLAQVAGSTKDFGLKISQGPRG